MRTYLHLARHCLGRFADNEVISPGGDPATGIGQVLAWVITPGMTLLIIALPVLPVVQTEVHYLLVSLSMAILGAAMLIEWDRLFPDRIDELVLTPLPIRPMMLFLARLTALAGFIGLFLIAANLVSAAAVSVFSTESKENLGYVMRIFRAHMVACGAGGVFLALVVAALEGALLLVFGRRAVRWIMPGVQVSFILLIVTVLIASPTIAHVIRVLLRGNHEALQWFPPFWFLGLYETMMPYRSHPAAAELATRAWQALGWAACAFFVCYVAGYRRNCRALLEAESAGAGRPCTWLRPASAILHRALLRDPQERATFHFIGRTLAGSARHRLFLSCYAGAAAAFSMLAFWSLKASSPVRVSLTHDSNGMLAVPMILSFFLLSGLRAAFNYPMLPKANWIFQLTEDASGRAHFEAMRKWILVCALLPLFALLAVYEFRFWPWRQALYHLAFGFTLSLLLREILFFDFRKVPFTCTYLPPAMNVTLLAAVYLFGFTTYSYRMAELEAFLGERAVPAAIFFGIAFGVLAICERVRSRRFTLVFEEEAQPTVQVLGLS